MVNPVEGQAEGQAEVVLPAREDVVLIVLQPVEQKRLILHQVAMVVAKLLVLVVVLCAGVLQNKNT